jgi:uncharacterized membrane protein
MCSLLYEMIVIQGSLCWSTIVDSFHWYDWIVVVLSIFFTLGSICFEADRKETDDVDDYVGGRIINIILCAALVWKSINLQQDLPYTLDMLLPIVTIVGLFSIFNFLFFLVTLLVAFGTYFVLNYSRLEGSWLYLTISGIIIVGLIIMINMTIDRKAAKKRKELEEENDFMREKLKEKYKNEYKWWKFWN